MSTSRLSISVPPEVEKTIRTAAADAGVPVSVWLVQAAERAAAEQVAIVDGLAAVAEFEAEHGILTDAERAHARQMLIDAGVIPPQRAAG
ncbi:MAG: hypothetical protein ACRDSH_14195 [Pseudonocardiaceae bacterium]